MPRWRSKLFSTESTHFLAQTPLWSLAILFVDLFPGEKHCLTPIEKPAQRLIHRPVLRSILPPEAA